MALPGESISTIGLFRVRRLAPIISAIWWSGWNWVSLKPTFRRLGDFKMDPKETILWNERKNEKRVTAVEYAIVLFMAPSSWFSSARDLAAQWTAR
jgi:hypothetical protein